MVNTLLIITFVFAFLSLIGIVLSYIFDVIDDFRPFTSVWYNASAVCAVIAYLLFAGSVLTLIISGIIYLIGG